MKKKYLVLVDGLFALLGSAINFFGPILILAMAIGAYKDTFRYFIALNIWNVFIFLVAIASKYLLREEKRIKKWIPNLFLDGRLYSTCLRSILAVPDTYSLSFGIGKRTSWENVHRQSIICCLFLFSMGCSSTPCDLRDCLSPFTKKF